MSFRLWHLALLLAATTLLAAASGVLSTYRVADEELHDILDDDLESQTNMLARLLEAQESPLSQASLERLLDRTFEADDEETLWVNAYDLRSGGRASNLGHDAELERTSSGSVRLHAGGHDWSGYQRKQGDLVVQILRRDDLYADLQGEMLEDIVTPAAAAGVVNLLLLATLIGLILWPLTRLVRELAARDEDALTPLALRTPITEVAVLRDTVNRLLDRVRGVLHRERQFASDVAHELRTPLTTLKVELGTPQPDLAALRAEVDRLARTVGQLLTLARLEEGAWKQRFAPVALSSVIARTLERFEKDIAAAGMSISHSLESLAVAGDEPLLEILVQNLLRNAVVHCPRGTRIEARLFERGGDVVFSLTDTGPGIAQGQRERMTARFTQLDTKGQGLGLGLAICHKIALAHGASIAFLAREDGAPGLRVEVCFPRGTASAT